VAHVGNELVLVLAGDFEVLDGLGKFARPRLNLFERRVFSIAITAWSAKVLTSSI
jgi:hypothetical protein